MADDLRKKIESEDKGLLESIDKYIDDLKNEAQGDYDFVVKFLKKQFQSALGTDDTARADFFAKVANQLEKRVGRIPYDYELKTGREKEDLANFLKQKDMEDQEQRKQEIEFGKQQELASTKEQKLVDESSNDRGMLGSGIQERQKQEVAQERQTNIIDPQNRVFAYQQALRDEQARLGKQSSGRNLEDITTDARRAGEDTQLGYDRGIEGANRTLESRLADIRRTERNELEAGSLLIEQNKTNKAIRDAYGF